VKGIKWREGSGGGGACVKKRVGRDIWGRGEVGRRVSTVRWKEKDRGVRGNIGKEYVVMEQNW